MLRDLLKYLLITLIGTLPVSCVFDDGAACIETSSAPHNIQFTVSLAQHGTTRATWGDEYTEDPGTAFENRILPDAMRVAVYTADNVKLGDVENLYYWPTNDAHTEFKFTGAMPEAFTTHFTELIAASGTPEYKIMVLANCPEGDEQELTYNYTLLDPATGAIPMWGILKTTLDGLSSSQTIDIGAIELLRSAAKLEVKLSDALVEYGTIIHGVYINYYNQTGYCLPTGWDTVDRTDALDLTGCFRLYRHAAVKRTFSPDEATPQTSFYTYVPEYDNLNTMYAEEKAKISIDLTHNGKRRLIEDGISLCKYSNGAPVEGSDYNIVRNHIYQYRITRISGEDLMLEYSVADWDTEDWGTNNEFEEHPITYPTYHNPVMPAAFFGSGESSAKYIITQEPTMYHHSTQDGAGAFECYFQVTAPQGVQWRPNIMGSLENYQIKVYDANKTLVYDSSADDKSLTDDLSECAAGNEWYKIHVFPKSDNGAGTAKVEFGIVYFQTWTQSYINLFINGDYGDIKWPESGDNPKLITIQHINEPHE